MERRLVTGRGQEEEAALGTGGGGRGRSGGGGRGRSRRGGGDGITDGFGGFHLAGRVDRTGLSSTVSLGGGVRCLRGCVQCLRGCVGALRAGVLGRRGDIRFGPGPGPASVAGAALVAVDLLFLQDPLIRVHFGLMREALLHEVVLLFGRGAGVAGFRVTLGRRLRSGHHALGRSQAAGRTATLVGRFYDA